MGGIAMRAIGLLLVVLGALGLGFAELGDRGKKAATPTGVSTNVSEQTPYAIPPVMSGITLTSGLILMASGLKRR